MEQLVIPCIRQPILQPSMTLDERFQAFHQANPHVLEELRKLALQAQSKGIRRVGIKMLWEVLRWRGMKTHGDAYCLNNSYTSRYARLLERDPALRGMFETRVLRSS